VGEPKRNWHSETNKDRERNDRIASARGIQNASESAPGDGVTVEGLSIL